MIRVLLVDDQNIMLEGLKALLEPKSDIDVIGTARNGFQALELTRILQPDIVLIDIEMPLMNGITATQKICQQFSSTKVLVLSGHEDEQYAVRVLQAGAIGYLLKSTLAEDLEKAIWLAHRGLSQLEPKLLRKIMLEFSDSSSIPLVSELTENSNLEKLRSNDLKDTSASSIKKSNKLQTNVDKISLQADSLPIEKANLEQNHIRIENKQTLSKAWKVFQITCLAVFATSLSSTMLFIAFPSIQNTYSNASAAQLSWVLNGYTILFASSLVTTGRLSDGFGRRKLFLFGTAIFASSSMLCGLANSLNMLIVARGIQAVGAAMIAPSSLGLILVAFPKSKRSTAVSLWSAMAALAAAVGPPLGGIIVQFLGWQWTFFLNIPICFIIILVGRKRLVESKDFTTSTSIDITGILMSIVGMSLLIFSLVQSSDWGWKDSRIFWPFVTGAVTLWMFLRRSAKVKFPAINLKLFENPNYRFANLSVFVFSIVFNAMFFGLMLFLTQIWQYSSSDAGLLLAPGPLLVIIISIVTGRIADVQGHRILIVPGGLFFALAGLLMFVKAQSTPSLFGLWIPTTLLIGLGVGLVLPALYSSALDGLPSNFYGIGSAINRAAFEIGSSLGVSFTVALLGNTSSNQLIDSFDRVFILLVVGGLLTSFLAMNIDTKSDKLPKGKTVNQL